MFKSLDSNGNPNVDDVIEGGAIIQMRYQATQEGEISYVCTNYADDGGTVFISSRKYANLEEWFYGDDILTELNSIYKEGGVATTLDERYLWFRRGVIGNDDGADYITIDPTGDMVMIYRSDLNQNNDLDDPVKSYTDLSISQLSSNIILETKPLDTNLDIFYEIGRTYDIVDGYHLGVGADIDQSLGIDAEITLPVFNCFSWGNVFESYKIRDEFNEKTMKIDTRPSTTVPDYKQNRRIANLNYSNVYEQETNYNALNEFNLGLVNYKTLDDAFGSIQKIFSKDTNLLVFQENTTLNIPYEKNVIYDAEGNENLIESNNILGTPRKAYASGEYGISKNPESFAIRGNRIYHTDERRGVILRLSLDGYTEISKYGLRDYVRDDFRTNKGAIKLGGYDAYHDQYILSFSNKTVSFDENTKGITSFHSYIPDWIASLNNRMYTIKEGQLNRHNDESVDRNNFYGTPYSSIISTVFNENPSDDKIFKTVILEGNKPWKATLSTNYTNGIINLSEFEQKESRYFAYIRKNEDINDLHGYSAQGIGNIV